MRHFAPLASGVHVSSLLSELDAHPELWDEHPYRTRIPGGPFARTSDLWVRFRDPTDLSDPQKFAAPHFAVWYPAAERLPSLKPLLADLMIVLAMRIRPRVIAHLGGILITRIPAGQKIEAHHDRGSWHAEFHDFKVYVPLRANEGCVNYCGDESVVMKPGEAWWFDNLTTHSVENNGDSARITLIVCMRTE